jgi:Rne/Rng family ribonuclease
MKKSLVISEQDNIGAFLENDRVVEFFVNRGELLLGDIYTASVENILPSIDAAFVNLGKDKMGFLHANDVPGQGPLKERLVPKQKLLVQITKEPTGHKGPRVSTAISLPGRFLVLVPEERGVSISRRISETRERARLKSVVNLMKPPGVGLIIRTEAKGQGEGELFEDFEQLWDRWQTVVSDGEASIGPTLIYRDQDLLFRVIRDAYSHDVSEIIVDTLDGQRRAQEYLFGWASKQTRISYHSGEESLLVAKGIDREIEAALSDRVELPSGGHLNIEPTEALTVIDVNSGRFTSSRTQAETVRRTNVEAAQEISRQLRLRNIGGMVIVDFIDMDSRKDQQQVLEVFQRNLEEDRAKPQVGQLSDLGLVELTRRRQGQSLRELFTVHCEHCAGLGFIPTLEIGPPENRKVISFKGRDLELIGARGKAAARRAAKPNSVLRAATAVNGRVLPTVEESQEFEDALAALPEHILEQMPDDLLDNQASVTTKRGRYTDVEQEGEAGEVPELDEQEIDFEPASGRVAHAHNFEKDLELEEPNNLSEDLSESISAVERVYNEYDRGGSSRKSSAYAISNRHQDQFDTKEKSPHLEESQTETLSAPANHSYREPEKFEASQPMNEARFESGQPQENHSHEAGAKAFVETAESVKSEPVEPESPFETVFDPVTGVYRLKAKEPKEEKQSETANPPKDNAGNEGHFELPAERQETEPARSSFQQIETARALFQSEYGRENQAQAIANESFAGSEPEDSQGNAVSSREETGGERQPDHANEQFEQLKLPTTDEA